MVSLVQNLYLIGIILCMACSIVIGLCLYDITLIRAWEDCDEKHDSKKKKITLNYNKNRLLIVSMVIALKSCVNYLYKHTHTHNTNTNTNKLIFILSYIKFTISLIFYNYLHIDYSSYFAHVLCIFIFHIYYSQPNSLVYKIEN